MNPHPKYRSPEPAGIENRQWPSNRITRVPVMVPVDLRDGNQAFAHPMDVETKLRYFGLLVKLGFKEIEVGFPSASNSEYEFVRRLIDGGYIPDDVRIVVFTAAKEPLTFSLIAVHP